MPLYFFIKPSTGEIVERSMPMADAPLVGEFVYPDGEELKKLLPGMDVDHSTLLRRVWGTRAPGVRIDTSFRS